MEGRKARKEVMREVVRRRSWKIDVMLMIS